MFVSINFSLEKDSVVFSAFVNYNIMLCIGNSLVLHCASLLRTIFSSLARAHEHVRIQNVRDFAQTKPDSETNAPFLSNEHGDPRFFFSGIF